MFEQVKLSYAYDALEPHIDAKTMEVHYSKHHATYAKNFNDIVSANVPECLTKPVEELFSKLDTFGTSFQAGLRNNGGGFYNHNLYFSILSPKGNKEPKGELADKIKATFGSYEALKEQITKAAVGRFGSGWAWLVVKNGKLSVCSTPNQDNTFMPKSITGLDNATPLVALDVWEHAYYLKYQNRRPDYIKAFFEVLDWEVIADLYKKAKY
ncbi:MAG: superoxide dismutase [Campylobacteraceae bacterium]